MSEFSPIHRKPRKNSYGAIISVGVFLVGWASITSYVSFNWHRKQVPISSVTLSSQKPLEHYTLAELRKLWWGDSPDGHAAAVKQFARRRVLVTGDILQFQYHHKLPIPQADVTIGIEGDFATATNCLFGDSEPWVTLAQGQTVTIEGWIMGDIEKDFHLEDCSIQQVSGDGCAKMTAEEYVALQASGEFARKYPQRGSFNIGPHVILSGTLKDIRRTNYYHQNVPEQTAILETADGVEVTCLFETGAPRIPTEAEFGRSVTVVGERRGSRSVNPDLQRCFLVDSKAADSPSVGF